MHPRPALYDPKYAAQYADPGIVAAYRYRPPYPAEVFDVLISLIGDTPRAVLDVGCGQGKVARPLAARVERVDAVDVSAPMVAEGKRLPGGDHPRLAWIVGSIETASLTPPYALITAASSLHWFDWEMVMPRFRAMLTPRGVLAVILPREEPPP